MTKARTEAQKRRDKKAGRAQQDNGMPELAAAPRKKRRGRQRMEDLDDMKQGADVLALETRGRHAGIDIVIVDNSEPDRAKRKAQREARAAQLRDMRAPWRGCEAGRAMASAVLDDAQRAVMWSAINHMRRVQAAYDRAIGAPNRHAQCLRLLLPLDALEADAASPPLDLRTDVEKRDQAVGAWMRVHGWLRWTDKGAASICRATVIEDQRCADPAALVRALHCVADGLAGRRMMYRSA